jgi:hypothetical protein
MATPRNVARTIKMVRPEAMPRAAKVAGPDPACQNGTADRR